MNPGFRPEDPIAIPGWLVMVSLSVLLMGCARTWQRSALDFHRLEIDQGMAEDPALETLLSPFRDRLDAQMADTLVWVDSVLELGKPESGLGNFLADLMVSEAALSSGILVDGAIQNYGGVRRSEVPKGPFRIGMAYELMPFDNALVILDLDSLGMADWIGFMAAQGGWPVSEGIRFRIGADGPEQITICGKALRANTRYRIATTDYLANGGDRCEFLKAYPRVPTGIIVRDAIIRHCRRMSSAGNRISPRTDGRITQIPQP